MKQPKRRTKKYITPKSAPPKQTASEITKLRQFETILTFERNFMKAAKDVLDNVTFAKIIGVAVENAHTTPAD